MNYEQFFHWLTGFMEGTETKTLTEKKTARLREEMAKVTTPKIWLNPTTTTITGKDFMPEPYIGPSAVGMVGFSSTQVAGPKQENKTFKSEASPSVQQ